MFRRKSWSVVSVLFVVNFIGVGCVLAAENEISPMTEEGEEAAALRCDILSKRSDALMEGFFESFKQSEKCVFDRLPEEISNEIFRLGKVLDMEVIDWLDYFTKWASSQKVDVLYHLDEDTDTEEWFENEFKMKSDFAKFIGVLLHVRENVESSTVKESIEGYLTALCNKLIIDKPRETELYRNFSQIVSYAMFTDNILKGNIKLLDESTKTTDESVICSVTAALLDNTSGKDTLWDPMLSDYSVGGTADWKFVVFNSIVIHVLCFWK